MQIQTNGIQESLGSTSPFTVPSSIDLFLFLCKSLSSMSNPLWCSHVCWSRARGAWDYYCWRHHTHAHTQTDSLYIHFQMSPFTMWGTTRMCQGTSMLAIDGLCGILCGICGNLLYGTRSGETSSYGLYQGKMI